MDIEQVFVPPDANNVTTESEVSENWETKSSDRKSRSPIKLQEKLDTQAKHIVYITGKTRNITKVNSLKIYKLLIDTFGTMEVYPSGNLHIKLVMSSPVQPLIP